MADTAHASVTTAMKLTSETGVCGAANEWSLVKSAKSLDISVDSFLAEDRRKAGRTVGCDDSC